MSEILCIHCGESCGKYPIIWEGKPFCCNGCLSVYQIIEQKKLYKYYQIDKTPGIKIQTTDYQNKYAYLDDLEIQTQIFEFAEGEMRKVKLFIPAIHCSSCIWLLENLNILNSGISLSLVNFVKKELTVTFKNNIISLRQLVELLVSINYIPHISLENIDKTKNTKTNRSLLIKIGIAGFAFGNTMLFSFPEYLPGSETIDFNYKTFFGTMNILLALPVFFYCANDYLLSAWKSIKNKIVNIDIPISIGLIAIFIESSYQIISSSGSGYMDSLAGLVFFLLIGKWYQAVTYQALSFERDYKSYFPVAVTKLEDSKEISIPIKKLEENDIIRIRNQELIPADAILINGLANIDYSFVTGESLPQQKNVGEFIYAGGKQIGSTIELKIKNKVEQSRLTQLWNQSADHDKTTKLSNLIDKISKNFTYLVLAISLLTSIFWLFIDSGLAIKSFTAVLIVACPCALALSIPFTFGNVMRIFGKNGLYLKKNAVVEKLATIDTIVFDKTGTITQANKQEIDFVGENLTLLHKQLIYAATRHSTHPLSVGITNLLKEEVTEIELDIIDFKEITAEGIIFVTSKSTVKIGSKKLVNLQTEEDTNQDTKVYVSINENILGYFLFHNKYRENLKDVLNSLSRNYELHLISGDNIKEKQRLEQYFKNNLHFNQSPEDKLRYIKNLQSEGKNVLMIGDGLNDAGALNQSNVSITLADDIYHFSPACEGILEAKQFHNLANFVRASHKAMLVVKSSFVFSILYNIVGLSFAVRGLLSPIIAAILMPMSSISVVAYVTLISGFVINKSISKKNI